MVSPVGNRTVSIAARTRHGNPALAARSRPGTAVGCCHADSATVTARVKGDAAEGQRIATGDTILADAEDFTPDCQAADPRLDRGVGID